MTVKRGLDLAKPSRHTQLGLSRHGPGLLENQQPVLVHVPANLVDGRLRHLLRKIDAADDGAEEGVEHLQRVRPHCSRHCAHRLSTKQGVHKVRHQTWAWVFHSACRSPRTAMEHAARTVSCAADWLGLPHRRATATDAAVLHALHRGWLPARERRPAQPGDLFDTQLVRVRVRVCWVSACSCGVVWCARARVRRFEHGCGAWLNGAAGGGWREIRFGVSAAAEPKSTQNFPNRGREFCVQEDD